MPAKAQRPKRTNHFVMAAGLNFCLVFVKRFLLFFELCRFYSIWPCRISSIVIVGLIVGIKTFFKSANSLTHRFAELGQFAWAKEDQENGQNNQPMCNAK